MATFVASLPGLALSGLASAAYALGVALWVATSGPREVILEGSRSAASVVAKAALQLLVSLLLSIAAYAALYAAFVPEADSAHPLHFGLCQASANSGQSSSDAAGGLPMLQPQPPVARVARLLFSSDDGLQIFGRSAAASSVAVAVAGAATVVPPLARAYDYTVGVCLRLPESPPNVDVGTFVASIRILSENNRTLLSSSRPLVLRYRSPQLRWMWTVFFAVPLLFGWMDEAQTQCTHLADAFTNLRNEPASRATIALVSPGACGLQVYEATIRFGAQLGSVTHAMSQYFFTAATIGVGLLMLVHWIALLLFEMRPTVASRSGTAPGATRARDSRAAAAAPGPQPGYAREGEARRRAASAREADAEAAAAAVAAARPVRARGNTPERFGGVLEEEEEEDIDEDDDQDLSGIEGYFREGDLYQDLGADDEEPAQSEGLRQRR